MKNLTKTIASIAMILLASLAIAGQTDSKKPDNKKENKDAPRKIEIAAAGDKVRAALIKAELDRGWDLGGDEQINRITFYRRPRTGLRDLFVLSSDGNVTTIYATTERCIPPYACERIEIYKEKSNPRNQLINERDALLDSIKAEIEAKPHS